MAGPKQVQIDYLRNELVKYQGYLRDERTKTASLESQLNTTRAVVAQYNCRTSRGAIVAALEYVQREQVQTLGGVNDMSTYNYAVSALPMRDPLNREEYLPTPTGRAARLHNAATKLIEALAVIESIK